MNSDLKKILVSEIDDQWLKGAKDLVMGYYNKTFVELVDCIYIHYGKTTPGYQMKNQDTMQTSHHIEETIEMLLYQIETGQEYAIAGNSPFSDHQLLDMVIAQILATQDYTHAYRMWKIISVNERVWVHFKAYFQKAHIDLEEIEQTVGAERYRSTKNAKHREI